jgi:hypothetical protein
MDTSYTSTQKAVGRDTPSPSMDTSCTSTLSGGEGTPWMSIPEWVKMDTNTHILHFILTYVYISDGGEG